MIEIKDGDRVILSRLDNEDEEYLDKFLNEEGIIIGSPSGTFPCVFVKFDQHKEENIYLFVKNLDKVE